VVKLLSVPPVLLILSDSWSVSTSDIINAGLQDLLFLQVTVSNLDTISYKRPI
jgi:hypothetical protein